MMTEEWRSVLGAEGKYEVSSLGSVRSLPRPRTAGGALRPSPNAKGYLRVDISGRSRFVHHLVAEAFHGTRPEGSVARHINGINSDNRATNIAWGTASDNEIDKLRLGTNPAANKTHCAQGHRFDEQNTIQYRGRRKCRTCANLYQRNLAAKRRAALASDPTTHESGGV